MLVTSNAEDTKKNVETFSNLLNKIVQSNVERALRQDSLVSTQSNKMTKDEESDYLVSGEKMSINKCTKFSIFNILLYKKLNRKLSLTY